MVLYLIVYTDVGIITIEKRVVIVKDVDLQRRDGEEKADGGNYNYSKNF